jgi:hypothetical protein
MNRWQRVWKFGIAPLLSPNALRALATALRDDDPRLVQGTTTEPMPLAIFADAPVEGACAIGFALWQGHGLDRVGTLHLAFRRLCCSADDLLDEALASSAFIHWFDDAPRSEMRRQLLAEIEEQATEPRRAA